MQKHYTCLDDSVTILQHLPKTFPTVSLPDYQCESTEIKPGGSWLILKFHFKSNATDHREHNNCLWLNKFKSTCHYPSQTWGSQIFSSPVYSLHLHIHPTRQKHTDTNVQIKLNVISCDPMRPVTADQCSSLQKTHGRSYLPAALPDRWALIRGASLLYSTMMLQPSSRCVWAHTLRGKTKNTHLPCSAHTQPGG